MKEPSSPLALHGHPCLDLQTDFGAKESEVVALSPPISIIHSSDNGECSTFSPRQLLKRELIKTAFILALTFLCVYLMMLEMVFIDNRSLDYVYGVTLPSQWLSFAEAVAKVNAATNDEGPFPIALVRPSFGGVGYETVFNSFPSEMNISSVYNGGILLPMDVVISTTQNMYIEWRVVADTLAAILLVLTMVFILAVPFLWRRKTAIFPVRGLVLGLTILPPGSLACVPKLRYTLWEKLMAPILLMAGFEVCCYDFMYSGHTSLTTVLVWFWILYFPGVFVNFKPRRVVITLCVGLFGALLVFLMIFSLTISRLHYSIDVALGLFIGSAAFWSWHTTLCLYQYQRMLNIEEPGRNRAFNWIVRLVGWMDGIEKELLPSCLPQDNITTQERFIIHVAGEKELRAIANSSATSRMASSAKSRSSLE